MCPKWSSVVIITHQECPQTLDCWAGGALLYYGYYGGSKGRWGFSQPNEYCSFVEVSTETTPPGEQQLLYPGGRAKNITVGAHILDGCKHPPVVVLSLPLSLCGSA